MYPEMESRSAYHGTVLSTEAEENLTSHLRLVSLPPYL